MALLLGLLVGVVLTYGTENDSQLQVYFFSFHQTFFQLALLPPIILWSGFQVYKDDFYTELGAILLFAIVGTIISVFIVGPVLWASDVVDMSLAEALTFASLISAVDPVGTLAVFGSLQVDPRLNILVFGESILNDAVSIVLYKTFGKFDELGFTNQGLTEAIGMFFLVCIGSVLIGLVAGVLSCLMLKYGRMDHHPHAQALLVFAVGLLR